MAKRSPRPAPPATSTSASTSAFTSAWWLAPFNIWLHESLLEDLLADVPADPKNTGKAGHPETPYANYHKHFLLALPPRPPPPEVNPTGTSPRDVLKLLQSEFGERGYSCADLLFFPQSHKSELPFNEARNQSAKNATDDFVVSSTHQLSCPRGEEDPFVAWAESQLATRPRMLRAVRELADFCSRSKVRPQSIEKGPIRYQPDHRVQGIALWRWPVRLVPGLWPIFETASTP